VAVSKPPEWPFRCPIEGWYLSSVAALYDSDESGDIPGAVVGHCKQHGTVTVTDPRAYAPDLWSTVEEQ
jgi:hypothetical protein